MSDGITFKLDDASHAKALAFLAAMRSAGPRVVIKSLNTMLLAWQREIIRHMPVDNGIARASIQVRKAEQDSDGRISGSVGTNVDYVKYLEFSFEKSPTGLFADVKKWVPGDAPIVSWAAKDDAIEELRQKSQRARSAKSRLNYERRIAKAASPGSEEFAPPFRGSWQNISAGVIDRLRNSLAKLMKSGKAE